MNSEQILLVAIFCLLFSLLLWGKFRYDLVALEDIAGGEELTTKYTFYNIK